MISAEGTFVKGYDDFHFHRAKYLHLPSLQIPTSACRDKLPTPAKKHNTHTHSNKL